MNYFADMPVLDFYLCNWRRIQMKKQAGWSTLLCDAFP